MFFINATVAAMVALGAATPALAAQGDAARNDALVTVSKPLTYTVHDDRQAAVTYLDDALTLLNLAVASAEKGERSVARAELMSASGKLSTAHLLMFKDRAFSRDLAPLSIRAERVYEASATDLRQARRMAAELANDLRPLYRTQVAKLGGGAGRGLEDLDQLNR